MNPNQNNPYGQNQPNYNNPYGQNQPDYNTQNQPNINDPYASNANPNMTSSQNRFNTSDWQTLTQTPLKVCMAVIAVSPSGPIGLIKEAKAMADGLKSLQQQQGNMSSPLLRDLGQHIQQGLEAARSGGPNPFENMKQSSKDPMVAKSDALNSCQQAMTLLRNTAPQDVDDYAGFVYNMAQKVAESGREGGFLGFGGQQVTEAEQQFLGELRNTLLTRH